MIVSGSDHDRAPARGGASDAEAARFRGEHPAVLGQACHLPVEPLDSPLQGFVLPGLPLDTLPQGFDLLGVPPLFHLVLRGQRPQGRVAVA